MKVRHLVIVAILSIGLTGQACFGGGSGPRGVWKSNDGADTWAKINQVSFEEKKAEPILDGVSVRNITVAPDRNDIIYISTPAGVFATDNGGKLWFHVLDKINVRDVAVSEFNPSIVYAVGSAGDRGVVYKSTDRGRTWEQKYIEASKNLATSVVANPSDTRDVFVGFSSGLLVNSKNGGETWSLVNSFSDSVRQVKFDPSNPRRVFLLLQNDGLFLSRDGGTTFSERPEPGDNSRRIRKPDTYYTFDLAPLSPNNLYAATDSGLFFTSNGGLNWTSIRLPVDPRSATTVALDVAGFGEILYISIDTVLYGSEDGGSTFNISKLPTNRLIRAISSLDNNPNVIYVGLTSF